jgi:hypothetical protein
MGDSWASMVNTPLLPMFQKSSMANNNATRHGQTVDLATAKLNGLLPRRNVPRLDGPEKFCQSSKDHVHSNPQQYRHQQRRVRRRRPHFWQHALGVGRVPSAPLREEAVAACQAAAITGPVHKVPHSRTPLRWPPHTNKPR